MKYKIEYTSNFKKDIKLISKRGKNLQKIYDVIEKLANNIILDFKYRDHQLMNFYFKNHKVRECHIEPDWLLIYCIDIKTLTLFLVRTGSHSDLF